MKCSWRSLGTASNSLTLWIKESIDLNSLGFGWRCNIAWVTSTKKAKLWFSMSFFSDNVKKNQWDLSDFLKLLISLIFVSSLHDFGIGLIYWKNIDFNNVVSWPTYTKKSLMASRLSTLCNIFLPLLQLQTSCLKSSRCLAPFARRSYLLLFISSLYNITCIRWNQRK